MIAGFVKTLFGDKHSRGATCLCIGLAVLLAHTPGRHVAVLILPLVTLGCAAYLAKH